MGLLTDRFASLRPDPGADAFHRTRVRWIEVTHGPGAPPWVLPATTASGGGSLAALIHRMAVLARHDARWAVAAPSGLALGSAAALVAFLLTRFAPPTAALAAAVAVACPVVILALACLLPGMACRLAAAGPRPFPGPRRWSPAWSALTAVLVTGTYLTGRRAAAGLLWPGPRLGGIAPPVLPVPDTAPLASVPEALLAPSSTYVPGPAFPALSPGQGIGVGLTLGAALTLAVVVAGVVLRLAGTAVRRYRERGDVIVSIAAPAVEALYLLPGDTSPLDPADKAAILAPMRRLAANLEAVLPAVLPVAGRTEQREIRDLCAAAARAVRSWEALVVASNPRRVRILRRQLTTVLAATLNGDYADLPVSDDARAGQPHRRWTSLAVRVTVAGLPLALVALAGAGGRAPGPGTAPEVAPVLALAWAVLCLPDQARVRPPGRRR